MRATFVELPPFERLREHYLDDSAFRALQQLLMANPRAGDVIRQTGGLRKLRFADPRRGKGKSGGLRVIYYWQARLDQFWLFTLYGKDEAADLSPEQWKTLGRRLAEEIKARGNQS